MNFLSNVLDSIPVVGHVKGVVHYAVGDTDGGHKAMYQSTRTSAVLAGGAVGALGGPAGAVLGGMYAGLATDGIASIAMDEPQGIVQGCQKIGHDIADGKNPIGSIASTSLQLGLDGVGGLGMGGVSSAASQVSEKAVAKSIENVGKKVAATVGEELIEKSAIITTKEIAKMTTKKVSEKAVKKAIEQAALQVEVVLVSSHIGMNASKRTEEERCEKEKREKENREKENREKENREKEKREKEERERKEKEKRANAEKQNRATSGKSSGSSQQSQGAESSQSPQGDKDNNKKSEANSEPDYFDIFMKSLRKLLKLIYGNDVEPFSSIFKKLSDKDKKYFVKIIEIFVKSGTLDAVVEFVIRIFKEHYPRDISYENFLSLSEFVQTFITDELANRIRTSKRTAKTGPKMKYHELRARILNDIISQKDIIQHIVALFKKLKSQIDAETLASNNIYPNFRDIFAAVYHYLKHRAVPGDGILSVKEYYDWIRKFLKILKETPEYTQLRNARDVKECVYEVYVVIFGRRFRIVIKVRGRDFSSGFNRLVLSSAYVVRKKHEGDKEGDVYIEIVLKDNFD